MKKTKITEEQKKEIMEMLSDNSIMYNLMAHFFVISGCVLSVLNILIAKYIGFYKPSYITVFAFVVASLIATLVCKRHISKTEFTLQCLQDGHCYAEDYGDGSYGIYIDMSEEDDNK